MRKGSSALAVLADRRAAEYIARQDAERRKQYEEAMARLRRDLGLGPDASLWEYVGLVAPSAQPGPTGESLDDDVASAMDDFFSKLHRVYVDGELWERHFPATERTPR